jgi:hypothetical protein
LLLQVFESCDQASIDLDNANFGSERTTESCFFPDYTGDDLCAALADTGLCKSKKPEKR